jgi:hypothetical protein
MLIFGGFTAESVGGENPSQVDSGSAWNAYCPIRKSAFCFSYYDGDGREFWFQVSLIEVADILKGLKADLDLRSPEP